ncbi:YbaB/EbfC family nucleoid-associated protein [Streptoalloteichus hindustanus]|uniref:Conserved DNA-binding protein YbaB n=1 Tax=Streptoalloteichus hindustanus TaxID=2017 RepID=A0A1M5H406_STRHI|nr:YbaB/EbfC family nucleoid-associated protein [Streptoalloteichus hindustanus]SHG10674.1 Conserved DNA-binding protein YbaB [Streptoalloteichus hindustanus]
MGEPVFGLDGARTEQELDRWAAEVTAKAERYQDMQQQVSSISSTAASSDGAVRVTVDSSGVLTGLEISDRVRQMSGSEVAALVLTTMRRAQARITDQVAEVMRSTVGDDAQTVEAVVGNYRQRFPEPEPEEATGSVGAEEMRFAPGDDADDTDEAEPPRPTPPPRSRPRRDDDEEWGGDSFLR